MAESTTHIAVHRAPARGSLASGTVMAIVIAISLMLKVALIAYLDGRVYPDVIRSVNFGTGVEQGLISIRTHVDNTKSFIGPLLNARLFALGGGVAIRAVNLAAFLMLCLTMIRIGRGRYSNAVILIALVLLAFYPGGHRNVVAGELEDNLASILFATGLLWYLDGKSRPLVGAMMAVAFLVKFWIALFGGAFGLVLLFQRRWREALLVTMGGLVPLALIAVVDHGATVRGLFMTVDRQAGIAGWGMIASRLVSTGLLPTMLLAGWNVTRRRHAPNGLFLVLLASYFLYVLGFRDPYAASFVMMLGLVTAGFLVGEALDEILPSSAVSGRRYLLAVVLGVYVVAGAGIAWLNLYRDTKPLQVTPGLGAKTIAHATHQVDDDPFRST